MDFRQLPPMLEVIVAQRDAASRTYRFDAVRIRIGRADDNDIVLQGEDCSRYHAEIVLAEGGYELVDRNSVNGIFRGTERIAEARLAEPTTVQIGAFTLTITPHDEAKPAPELYLVYEAAGTLRSFKVASGVEYLIGRSPKADLFLEERGCSKEHATVFSRGGEFRVRDLGSSNGTVLDGRRIDEARLDPGSRLLIGQTLLTVQKTKADVADEEALLEGTRILPTPERRARTAAGDRGAFPGAGTRRLLLQGGAAAAAALVALAIWIFGVRGPRERPASAPGGAAAVPGAPQPAPPPMTVRTAKAASKELVFAISATGSAKPERTVTVGAEIAGRIVEVPIEENHPVEKKSLLARLDDTDIGLKIAEARASIRADQVTLARDDYERKRRLFDKGVVTRSVFEQSKNGYLVLSSTYDATRARIRQLEEQLAKTRISAPISGIVVEKFATEGELLAPGTPVATIADLRQVLVEAELSDRDIVKIRPGQAVVATTDAYKDRAFEGAVEKISSLANPVSKTFRIEARLANADLAIKAGMIVYLRIVLDKAWATVIPEEALVGDAGRTADVYVVAGGAAKRVAVELGRRADRDVEVLAGVAGGDEVVVEGQDQLVDGRSVRLIGP
ncbi:MAG: rane fusion protein multidrug efflux system [Candidatus Binatota bacterium]|nr:rane fusion protein multidrug efflux system [Candidatus Binatota bacterium]